MAVHVMLIYIPMHGTNGHESMIIVLHHPMAVHVMLTKQSFLVQESLTVLYVHVAIIGMHVINYFPSMHVRACLHAVGTRPCMLYIV